MNRRHPLAPCYLLLLAFSVPLWSGCGSGNQPGGKPKVSGGPTVNPLSAQFERLDKEPSEAVCREVLNAIENRDNEVRPSMTEQEQKKLLAMIPLQPNEIAMVASEHFGPNDARYMEECLLLSAVIRGMDLGKYPDAVKARLVFEWVCRQIHIDFRMGEPVVPPWFALQSGRGTPVDRAYVFLSLLNQLKLDGCLVGSAEMRKRPLLFQVRTENGIVTRPNFPPLVGVRIEKDIFLFDPFSGKPIIAADGKTVATLAQLRTSPEKFVAQFSEPPKAEEVKKWEVTLTCPMEGLAPRMLWLQDQMKEITPVVFTWDAQGMQNRFRKEAGETTGCEFWCLPQDIHALGRLGLQFNAAPQQPGNNFSLAQRYMESVVPIAMRPILKFRGQPVGGYGQNLVSARFSDPIRALQFRYGSPRDHILRAQFREATVVLEEIRAKHDTLRQQAAAAGNLLNAWEEWTKIAVEVYAIYGAAQDSGDAAQLDAAKAELSRLERNPHTSKAFLYVDRESGRIQAAEASYALALAVHEQAERLQARLDHQPTPQLKAEAENKWRSARDWWQSYLNNHADVRAVYREREAHARTLLTRCDQFAPKPLLTP